MRNLKRALSMALAAIMVLGLMVVGASATSYEDFTDKDEIKNQEAVNTMVSLGVISGKDNGSYDPTGSLTRAEACTLIARMLGGGKDPVLGSNIKSNFTDTKGHWAETYIAYCANLGIIVGVGDGSFNPDGTLTGTAAAKMVLCALGYKPEFEGIGGANWELATNTLATKVKLYDGLDSLNPSQTITRDQVAQLIYNGVQADEVEYRNLQGDYSGTLYAQPVNGTDKDSTMLAVRFKVVKVEGVVVANDIMAIDGNGTTVANKARLTDVYVGGTHRVNSSNVLLSETYPVALDNSYLGQRVVLYVKGLKDLAPNAASTEVVGLPILSQDNTVATTTKRMKDADAVRSFLSDNGLTLPTNGVKADSVHGTVTYTEKDTVINNSTTFDRTFAVTSTANVNGTEFTFIDHNGDGVVDYIFKTLPKMAKVTVYDETNKKLTIAGQGSINFADIANEADVAKDDIVLYYKVNDTYYLEKAETVSGKVESYNDNNKTVTVDGTSYGKSTVNVELSSTDLEVFGAGMPVVGNTYTFYLDNNGNAVAWVLGEESVGNYALVLASDKGNSTVVNSGEVKLMLSDGTTITASVNLLASANKFTAGKSQNTTAAKESWMTNKLASNGMKNDLVTYVLGKDGKVTLGDPTINTNYSYVEDGANGYTKPASTSYPVQRSTARYLFTNSDTSKNLSISVNDSTLFFIRNETKGSTADSYTVVKGLSNLPTTKMLQGDGTDAEVMSIVYSNTAANPNVAKAVFVDAKYEGTANYVYITDSYTGTVTVNGEEVYTYPVVFENGEKGELKINTAGIEDGKAYRYTLDNNGIADVSEAAGTNVYNGYVTTYAKGSNLSVTLGDGSGTVKSYTVLADAKLWNVEGTPYAETLSSDMSISFVLDTDGFVKTVFVKDTNVTKTTNLVSSVSGLSFRNSTVYSGFNAIVTGGAAGDKLTYVVTYDNGNTETKTVEVKNDTTLGNVAKISVPDNASKIEITASSAGGGTTPTPGTDLSVFSTTSEVNTALKSGNATINGSWTSDARLEVPAGKTLTIKGNYTGNAAGDYIQGTLVVEGNYTAKNVNVVGTIQVPTGTTTLADNSMISGSLTTHTLADVTTGLEVLAGGTLNVTNTNSVTKAITSSGTLNLPTVGAGALTVKDGTATIGSGTGAVGGALTVEKGTVKAGAVTGAVTVSGGTTTLSGAVTGATTVSGGTLNAQNLGDLTVSGGTVAATGTVSDLKDVATGSVTIDGAVTTVTKITSGTVEFKSTVTTVTEIAGGDVTFGGAVTELQKVAGTGSMTVNAKVTFKPSAAATLEAMTINVGATGELELDGTTATINVAAATLNGVAGAKITLSNVTTNNVTVGTDQLFQNNGTAETAGALSTAKEYVYGTKTGTMQNDGFIATT